MLCILSQCHTVCVELLWVECNTTSLLSTVLCLSDQQPSDSCLDRTAGAQPVPDLPDWWVFTVWLKQLYLPTVLLCSWMQTSDSRFHVTIVTIHVQHLVFSTYRWIYFLLCTSCSNIKHKLHRDFFMKSGVGLQFGLRPVHSFCLQRSMWF